MPAGTFALMYNPPHFASTDLTWLDWLAEHYPFCTLVSQVDGEPFASHLPILYTRTGDQVLITGHWARPNAQWRDIENQRVMLMFHGPHAYVSPRWYADAPKQVPTWNYVTAHVYGRIRLIQGEDELASIVARLAEKFESGAPEPWSFNASEPANRARLRGIVGFELSSDALQIKIKLKVNQNHNVTNVAGVISGLRATDSQEAAAVADLMQKELDKR
jgi:transcriptional regulator